MPLQWRNKSGRVWRKVPESDARSVTQDRSASASSRSDIGRASDKDQNSDQRDTWTKVQTFPRHKCVPSFCAGYVGGGGGGG